MSQICKIAVLGGDQRQYYLVAELLKRQMPVAVYGLDLKELKSTVYHAETLKEALSFGQIVIGPVPFCRNGKDIFSLEPKPDLTLTNLISLLNENHILFGGCICKSVQEYCTAHHYPFYDFMEMETVSIANAVATAEGSIAEAILHSPLNLHKSKCIVTGFGRCAKILADKLKGLGAHVTIAARKPEALALAMAYGYDVILLSEMSRILPDCRFLFNTIPAPVFDAANLSYVSKDATIIDIASAPGGTNFEYCNQLNINSELCLGLPGKYAPKASAEILVNALVSTLSTLASS